ncbi:MAG: nucleotide disphospho-sugar-binding domain-containing protein [Candidatus Binataceae bacterium]
MPNLPAPRRILIVHWDGAGNQPPQRALARALVRRGHEVHVLTSDSVAAQSRTDGAVVHRFATAWQYSSQLQLAPDEELSIIAAKVWGSPAYAADFGAIVEEVRPDICLIDCMLLSILSACRARGIPTGVLFHSVYGSFDQLLEPVMEKFAGAAEKPSYSRFLETFNSVLVFGYPAFSLLTAFAPCVHHVGPIREAVQSAPWPRRYRERPFILVSLSTSFQHQSPVLKRICEALSSLPVEALITTGPNMAVEQFSAGGGVELRSFVPHDRMLPFTDLLITHAGHGTAVAGAGSGVPMLCMPMGRDQPFVASRVEALGLGRSLSPDASVSEIGKTVSDMAGDSRLRASSRAFAAGVGRFGDLERAAELAEGIRAGDAFHDGAPDSAGRRGGRARDGRRSR